VHPLAVKVALAAAVALVAGAVGIVQRAQPVDLSSDVVKWAVAFSAVGTLVVAGVSLYLTRKVKEVHVLVNSRMSAVLEHLGIAQDKIDTSRQTGLPVPPADDRLDPTAL
jgi:hypothetical protein